MSDDKEALVGLYVATIVHEDERGTVHVFAAMVSRSAEDVRRRLRAGLGSLLKDAATVRFGSDPSEPLACAMVSHALADVLALADENPSSSIALGLDVHVEQRFTC